MSADPLHSRASSLPHFRAASNIYAGCKQLCDRIRPLRRPPIHCGSNRRLRQSRRRWVCYINVGGHTAFASKLTPTVPRCVQHLRRVQTALRPHPTAAATTHPLWEQSEATTVAKAVGLLHQCRRTYRIREQAHSYSFAPGPASASDVDQFGARGEYLRRMPISCRSNRRLRRSRRRGD
jgi:hypothetical protein